MRVQILDYSSGHRQVMGVLEKSADDRVQFVGTFPDQIRHLLQDLLDRAGTVDQFLQELPFHVTGSRLRAEYLE